MISRPLLIATTVLFLAVLGMSIYVWHMRRAAANVPVLAKDSRSLAPPVAGPTEQVTLYVAYDSDGTLRPQAARIPMPSGRQQSAEELLRTLLSVYLDKNSPHVIPAGADVRSVFLVDPGVAVIDLNSAFADGHRSGILVEELTVTSLIRTITANIPGLVKVKILVDGQQRETLAGHASLNNFYDVSAVNQLATSLQSTQ